MRSLEEGHGVLFHRSLGGVASGERSKVSDRSAKACYKHKQVEVGLARHANVATHKQDLLNASQQANANANSPGEQRLPG